MVLPYTNGGEGVQVYSRGGGGLGNGSPTRLKRPLQELEDRMGAPGRWGGRSLEEPPPIPVSSPLFSTKL